MTTTRIKDNRIAQSMTIEQADELFREPALKETEANKQNAITDKKIAVIKENHAINIAALQCEITALKEQLSDYIGIHTERFQKPRQRATNFGKYGVRTVTEVKLIDEEAIIAFAKEQNLPLFKIEYKLDKKAIEKLLLDGKEVPGATRIVGDVISYSVTKLKDEKE